jgi:hypothetical protein
MTHPRSKAFYAAPTKRRVSTRLSRLRCWRPMTAKGQNRKQMMPFVSFRSAPIPAVRGTAIEPQASDPELTSMTASVCSRVGWEADIHTALPRASGK